MVADPVGRSRYWSVEVPKCLSDLGTRQWTGAISELKGVAKSDVGRKSPFWVCATEVSTII